MFYAGFSRTVINPPEGIDLEGYYIQRLSDGVLDDLEINALALSDGRERTVLLSLDLCLIKQRYCDILRKRASDATGLPFDRLFVSCTHTHTSPVIRCGPSATKLMNDYFDFLSGKIIEASRSALADLKPATAGRKTGRVPGITHCRRILMKDGSIKTNPGTGNPDAVREVSQVDDRVSLIRFDREGADSILVAGYGNHPDAIGGNRISADYPGFFRRCFEAAVPGTKCIYLNGAEGDINFIDVFAKGGDLNDTFRDFDDVFRGYDHSRYIGESLAGTLLQIHRKTDSFEPVLKVSEMIAEVPSNMPTPEEAVEAHRIHELHAAGRDSDLPYSGMMLTTVVAEAERMIQLEHGPETVPVRMFAIVLGPCAILGIAGEPFTGVGLMLKEAEGFDTVLPVVNACGSEGYFPMEDSYSEGGYEARSSRFRAGSAEFLAEEGKKLLKKTANKN